MTLPKLRFGAYSSNWIPSKIGDIATVTSGGTPSRDNKNYWGGNIPWVTTSEIKYKNIYDSREKITAEGLKHSSAKLFNPGTILMAMYGQGNTRGDVAKLEIEAATNQACAAIIPHKDFDVDFIFQYLIRQYEEIRGMSNEGGQKNLSGSIVKNISLHFPELLEQKKIASFFSAVDKKISLLAKKHELLLQYKKGVMQKLFNQEIKFKDKNGQHFQDWKFISLAEMGATFNGLTGKSSEDFGRGAQYITYKQIFDSSKIDPSRFGLVNVAIDEDQHEARFGDLFFTTSSETSNEVGYCSALLDDVKNLYLNSFCFGYRIKSFQVLSPNYARFMFFSSKVRGDIVLLAQGSTRYNISKAGFMKIKVPVPDIEEQEKIASFLESLERKIDVIHTELELIKHYKQGLLQQMFVQ